MRDLQSNLVNSKSKVPEVLLSYQLIELRGVGFSVLFDLFLFIIPKTLAALLKYVNQYVNSTLRCCKTFVIVNKGTRTVLMKDCPEKLPEKSFNENDIFSMKKVVGSTLDLSTKAFFSLDKYQLKNMG